MENTRHVSGESPVLKFKLGPTAMTLIVLLQEFAKNWEEWWRNNAHQPPEITRTTVHAYKVALVTELLFAGEVKTHDFARKLSHEYYNRNNFGQACSEVNEIIEEADHLP